MTSENRYSIDFTLSVLEKNEARKLIKERKINEYIKQYDSLNFIKKTALIVFSFAALLDFLILFGLITLASKAPDYVERSKLLSIITFIPMAIFILLLYTYDSLMKNTMRNNHSSEITGNKLMLRLKINRSHIEEIMEVGSYKIFWNYVKKHTVRESI
ncbi:TPA: YcxB family protein, partial [Escherichia coli]|nr:YcxB family protein [Escherichia coli]